MNNTAKQPLISIGVVTYKRNDLLRETLRSILAQGFTDFEVVIGNDFIAEAVSGEVLGIDDPRIRYLNHAVNLGQLKNMNSVLEASRGRFFTWLNDDDLYHPAFLESVAQALGQYPSSQVIFTEYEMFGEGIAAKAPPSSPAVISTPETNVFLELYLKKQLPVIGCYGVFERFFLRSLGGMPNLGHGPPLYADNLLTILGATGGNFALVESPLVRFRTHPGSFSNNSQELDLYYRLQKEMFLRCISIFGLRPQRFRFLYLLACWLLDDGMAVALRARRLRWRNFLDYCYLVYHFTAGLLPSAYSLGIVWVYLKKLGRIAIGRGRGAGFSK